MGKQRWLIKMKMRKEESGGETKEQGTKEQTEVVSIEYGTKREAVHFCSRLKQTYKC